MLKVIDSNGKDISDEVTYGDEVPGEGGKMLTLIVHGKNNIGWRRADGFHIAQPGYQIDDVVYEAPELLEVPPAEVLPAAEAPSVPPPKKKGGKR